MLRQPYQAKLVIFFIISLIIFLGLRLWNLSCYSYFIYDQGRDAVKLSEIAHGEFTLVGPTSGLAGFFLGPLWFYLGLPGFLLSGGSPLGVDLWFTLLSALIFPGVWWLCWQLFWKEEADRSSMVSLMMGAICLALFIILPGSITSSTTIWNPLISAPLMMGALFSFWQIRRDEKRKSLWLALGFLAVALTLQSEFAYAVFYLPILFLLIPWFTQRRKVIDFVTAAGAIGATLVPQLLFELRNKFIMTNSLLTSLADKSKTVSWAQQLQNRPRQLLDVTIDFFNGPDQNTWLMRTTVVVFCLLGVWSIYQVWQKNKHTKELTSRDYLKQLLILFALIPYPFFLVWRGNEGNFFWYYFTPHFIFIIPLLVLGLEYVVRWLWQQGFLGMKTAGLVILCVLTPMMTASIRHWNDSIGHPLNETGYAKMLQGVKTAYQLQAKEKTATLILTPNIHSEHYDYLFHWYGQKNGLQISRTVPQEGDKQLILVTEQWGPELSDYVKAERKKLTAGWKRQRTVLSGKIVIEEWIR